MQFALLIYQPDPFDPKSLTDEERKAIADDYRAVNTTPGVTPGLPLGVPNKARTVRVVDGRARVTDGPFVNAAGAVGGYGIVEVANHAEALSIAARIPAARLGGAVEVRPIEVYW